MSKMRNTPDRGDVDVAVTAHHPGVDGVRPLNARSLALSILLGTHPPELPARAFVALAELFGITSGTMRTALSRLVTAGDVESAGGTYRLATRLRERQDAQDAGRRAPDRPWDGTWHVIVAATDQRDLAERRAFRATMANRRYGELRPAIWTRPANLATPPIADDWIAVRGGVDGIGPDLLVARLWDLDGIAATAHRLLDEMARLRSTVDWTDASCIPALFTTSAGVVRFLRNEPMLPGELTPDGWPVDDVRAAYDRFDVEHQRLLQSFLRRA